MKTRAVTFSAMACAIVLLLVTPPGLRQEEHQLVRLADLKWADIPSLQPGAKIAVIELHGTGPWGVTYVNEADDPRKKK